MVAFTAFNCSVCASCIVWPSNNIALAGGYKKDALNENIRFGLRVPHLDNLLSPILLTLPLQMLAYHVALLKNCDVDKPRNLAKSVTVE